MSWNNDSIHNRSEPTRKTVKNLEAKTMLYKNEEEEQTSKLSTHIHIVGLYNKLIDRDSP